MASANKVEDLVGVGGAVKLARLATLGLNHTRQHGWTLQTT